MTSEIVARVVIYESGISVKINITLSDVQRKNWRKKFTPHETVFREWNGITTVRVAGSHDLSGFDTKLRQLLRGRFKLSYWGPEGQSLDSPS